jgi:hypothetical protein
MFKMFGYMAKNTLMRQFFRDFEKPKNGNSTAENPYAGFLFLHACIA